MKILKDQADDHDAQNSGRTFLFVVGADLLFLLLAGQA
jgi:hypothetical protein